MRKFTNIIMYMPSSFVTNIRKIMEIEKRGSVVLIWMNKPHQQNKLTSDTMQELVQALDRAVAWEDVTCLVTTGMGNFYSTGLDINTETPLHQDPHQIANDMGLLHTLLARLLTFPLPTIAAITGHAFGGGAFLSLAHDYRIMTTGRGWWCIPAATIGLQLPLPTGLTDLLRAKVPVVTQSQVILARRFSGEEAQRAGIVNEVCPGPDMTHRALAAAAMLTGGGGGGGPHLRLHRETLANIKCQLYSKAYTNLSNGIIQNSKL